MKKLKENLIIKLEDNITFCPVFDPVKKYIDKMHQEIGYSFTSTVPDVDINDYASNKDNYKYHNIEIPFENLSNSISTLYLSNDPSFKEYKTYKTKDSKFVLDNLLPGRKYYYYIKNNNKCSEVKTFNVLDYPLMLNVGNLKNVRDLGGTKTKDGRSIKFNKVYRGFELIDEAYDHPLDDPDWGHYHKRTLSKKSKKILLNDFKIKTELDLRKDAEADYTNVSQLDSSVKYVRIPINAYYNALGYAVEGLDPSSKEGYRKVFKLFANKNNYPIYMHCWGGADRTGTVAFFLKALAGCSLQDLIIDYEITSFSGALRTHRYQDPTHFTTFHQMLNGLKDEYCKDEEKDISTGIRNYMKEFLELTDEEIDNIKRNLLD